MLVKKISNSKKISLIYHNFFDYPLSLAELKKWQASAMFRLESQKLRIRSRRGLYFIASRDEIAKKYKIRREISAKKLKIAKKVASYLTKIPFIKMVAITGSLAMKNSRENSDIDLMVIAQKDFMWTARLITLLYLKLIGVQLRKARDKEERDKICINIWMDEKDLEIKDKNIYTAHEICQIIPLINKDKTYEKFICKNRWIKDYWPNSIKILNSKSEILNKSKTPNPNFLKVLKLGNLILVVVSDFVFRASNLFCYAIQYQYMKPKMTSEIVTETRAFFHPYDWSSRVLKYLEENGIYEKA